MLTCWNCKEEFEPERNDDRPFVFHECNDGTMAGHKNPNLKKMKKVWARYKTARKGFVWQDFGGD